MTNLDRYPLALSAASDVKQATQITASENSRSCGDDAIQFIANHFAGNLWHFGAERAAKTATDVALL